MEANRTYGNMLNVYSQEMQRINNIAEMGALAFEQFGLIAKQASQAALTTHLIPALFYQVDVIIEASDKDQAEQKITEFLKVLQALLTKENLGMAFVSKETQPGKPNNLFVFIRKDKEFETYNRSDNYYSFKP